ncbi:membrane protein [Streptococcus suis]|nr:membrane protein [Streptococcus suis]
MWTETSDWALSEKISPPNAFYDEHYLCTVGAAGHRKLVKPIRMGERHGHRVVVNRQLQIANAFEQILEERCPRLHGLIRSIYDRYGYPISKHIRKAWQADLIYLIMKPAEWLFLIVIYLHDRQPENRIAVQYLPLSKIYYHKKILAISNISQKESQTAFFLLSLLFAFWWVVNRHSKHIKEGFIHHF